MTSVRVSQEYQERAYSPVFLPAGEIAVESCLPFRREHALIHSICVKAELYILMISITENVNPPVWFAEPNP